MDRPVALVVDQDPAFRAMVRDVFEDREVLTLGAGSGAEAAELLKTRPIDILLLDPQAPGVEAMDLLRQGLRLSPPPILIGVADSGVADETNRLDGAFDVLTKPLAVSRLELVVRRALDQRELLLELRGLREELQSREGYHGIVGCSSAMERLRDRLRSLADPDVALWLTGEPGTGKELAARTLHGLSRRREGAFVVASCSELPAGDLEPRIAGSLEQARGGTLYLEDVGSLVPALQERLLSLLDSAPSLDVRLVASSGSDPRAAAEQGRLVEGLVRRLAGEVLELVPLRERPEDIPLLARHFVAIIREINHLPPIALSPEALGLLERYRWPDNVQGLRNTLEQAVILVTDGTIRPRDLPDRVREAARSDLRTPVERVTSERRFRDAKREVVEQFERVYLRDLLERHGGNVTAASEQAGMLRSALQRLLRKYGLRSAEFRESRRVAAPSTSDRAHGD